MLAYIGASVAGLAYAPVAQAQTPPATFRKDGRGQRFDPAVVIDIARQLSTKPFVPPAERPAGCVREPESGTIRRAIRYTQPPIWSTDGRGIAVEPLHRGFVFSNAVDLYRRRGRSRSPGRL